MRENKKHTFQAWMEEGNSFVKYPLKGEKTESMDCFFGVCLAGAAGASVASAANARLCRGAACGACGARRRARAAVRSISAVGYPMNVASQRSKGARMGIVRVVLGSCRGEFACRSPAAKRPYASLLLANFSQRAEHINFRGLPPAARTETRRSVLSNTANRGTPVLSSHA